MYFKSCINKLSNSLSKSSAVWSKGESVFWKVVSALCGWFKLRLTVPS